MMGSGGRRRQGGEALLRQPGSYTVEAAFVMPLVLAILFAYIFLVLLLHDEAVIQGRMEERMVQELEQTAEKEGIKDWQKDLQGQLWVLRIEKVKKQRKMGKLQLQLAAETDCRIPGAERIYPGRRRYEQKEEWLAFQPEQVMRWSSKEAEDGERAR